MEMLSSDRLQATSNNNHIKNSNNNNNNNNNLSSNSSIVNNNNNNSSNSNCCASAHLSKNNITMFSPNSIGVCGISNSMDSNNKEKDHYVKPPGKKLHFSFHSKF